MDQTIGEIVLSESTKLIFTVNEWRDRLFASVRKFIVTQKYEGWTKSGISMNGKLLFEIIDTLNSLERALPPKEKHEFKRLSKNETKFIVISTIPPEDEFLPFVDVREFIDTSGYQGPTKRGIRFRWNVLPGVIACMSKQAKVINEIECIEPTLFGPGAIVKSMESKSTSTSTLPGNNIFDLLGENVKSFPFEFLDCNSTKGTLLTLPDTPLRLEQDNSGAFRLKSEDGNFYTVRNPVEANFIVYSQMRRHSEIIVPYTMISIFKAVKSYENYVRTIQSRLITIITKKVDKVSVAEYEARKKTDVIGLPWLLSK